MNPDIRNEIDLSGPDPDRWGEAMGAFFDIADVLEHEGAEIPHSWGWHHGPLCTGTEAYERFGFAANHAPLAAFVRAGNILERYTRLLRRAGLDY